MYFHEGAFVPGAEFLTPDILQEANTGNLDLGGQLPDASELAAVVDEARSLVADAYIMTGTEMMTVSPPVAEATETIVDVSANPVAAAPSGLIAKIRQKVHERASRPKLTHRYATAEDIGTLVDIDMKAFERVYREYDEDDLTLRQDLHDKFQQRFDRVGGEWIRIIELNGKPAGFMMSCPTNKQPEEFVSWEETTDKGTLETTYDPDGKNLYVVSLSVLPEASSKNGQDMLIAHAIGQLVDNGMERAFFESRMPGLRTWAKVQCRREGRDFEALSEDDKATFANTYFGLTSEVDGKEVPRDRLLRLYHGVGCKLMKLVPDAYQDEPSMNFGVVAVYENPLPEKLQKNRLASAIVGKAIKVASKSFWAMKKVL